VSLLGPAPAPRAPFLVCAMAATVREVEFVGEELQRHLKRAPQKLDRMTDGVPEACSPEMQRLSTSLGTNTPSSLSFPLPLMGGGGGELGQGWLGVGEAARVWLLGRLPKLWPR